MSNHPYVVYLLWDPRNGDIRYIGKTCSPKKRFEQHRYAYHSGRYCRNWELLLRKEGLSCEVSIVEEEVSAIDAAERERWWIAYGRSCGWRLTNLTSGGEGMSGNVPSEETREKLRQLRLGKEISAQQKEKLRQAQCKVWQSSGYREKAIRAHLGSRASAETREIMSKAQRRRQTRERQNAEGDLWTGELWAEKGKEET